MNTFINQNRCYTFLHQRILLLLCTYYYPGILCHASACMCNNTMRHAFPPAFCWGTHLCVGSIHDEVAEQKCIMISSALLSPIHEMVERDPCTDIDPGVFSYLKNSRLVRIQQAGRKSIHIITVWLHSRHVTPCDTNSSTCDVINAKIIKIPSRVKN